MNAFSVFSFQESHPVRVVMVDGNPWFVAMDICAALNIANPSDALRKLDQDEKLTLGLTEAQKLDRMARERRPGGSASGSPTRFYQLLGKAVNTATSNPRQKAPMNHWTGGKRKNYAA